MEMTEIQQVLARNLKDLRAARKWNQDDLAEAAGLSTGYVKEVETGRAWVGLDSVTALAKGLKVPEARLFLDPNAVASAQQEARQSAYRAVGEALGMVRKEPSTRERLDSVDARTRAFIATGKEKPAKKKRDAG